MPTNTLPTDSNSVLYEGVRDTSGAQFVAKAGIGAVTTDAGSVASQAQATGSSDGAHATLGTTSDAAYAGSGAAGLVALLKGIYAKLAGTLTVGGSVSVSNFPATQPVSGTFWQATQPVSAAALPLPAGAATSAKQPALGTAGAASADVLSVQGIASMTPLKTDGSGVTQPVSGTVGVSSLPAVSGTVTANAGTGTFTNQQSNVTSDYDTGAGTQTMTMFGVALPASGGAVAGGTAANPVRTDPTGTTTQPVSGAVTANAGTNLNTSLLALEAGGNLAALKADADTLVTNTTGLATQATLAAAKTDLDTLVTQTSGLATAANQATGNTSLASVVTNTAHTNPAGSNTALTTPPAQTNAGSDTALTFSATVNHWCLQNNSSANLYYQLDAAASTATFVLAPGAQVWWDWPVTVMHVFTASAINVNGASGLVLIGRA